MKRIYGLVTATLLVLLVFATSKTRAEGYGLNIAGVSVTSGNCNKLNTIDGVRGELKYDHASKTLTLKNVKITPPKGKIAIENTGVQNLKIDVSGNNELSANNADGLSFGASATITGYGKLTVRTGDYHSAVYVRKDVTLTIENTTLDAEGRNGIFGQDGGNGTVVIRQATVSAKGGYGYAITDLADLKLDDCRFASPDGIFWNSWYKAVVYPGGNRKVVELKIEPNYGFSIAGVMITPENYNKLNKIDGVRGELKYDRASKILTLENVKITPPKGKIAIENTDAVGLKIVVSGNNELTTNNADGIAFRASATITGEGELRVKTEGNNCAVYVRGEEVTLTVENTTLFAEGNNGILGHKNFFTYGKLIVRNAMVNAKGRDGHAIIDLDEFRLEKSSFVLPEGGAWDANQHAVMAGSAKAKEVRIEPNYGLYIAGVAVTSKNCNKLNTIEGVRGELKYDPAKKLLTMKDAKITPPEGKIAIENVELLDLKIDVLGNNEFTVSRADGLSFGASATITGKGKLTVKTGWNHAAVYVRKGATLTVENTTIDIEGENGFFGQDGRNGILVIRNATVSAKTIHEGYAITDLKVLNLDKAHIVHPEAGEWHYPGHVVTNGGDLNQKATFVKIEPFYEFHIAEKAITSGNVDKLDKIYGVTVPTDGMLKYNTATRTLTMKNVKITPRFKKNAIVSVGTSDLKIEVLGTNEITTDWADALSFGTSATITGEGTLTVKTAGDNAAIYVRKGSTLTVENITLAAEGKNGILGQDGHNGKLVVRSATVDAKGREGYAISDLQDFRLEKSQIVEPKGGEWNADRHAVMDGGAKAKVVKIRVLVTGVTLDKTTLTFTIGDAAQTLTASVAPANATNKKVTWTSNKTDVATVDENGTVTAVGVGEATITVTTEDGGKTAACTVTVNPVKVTGVTLDKTTLTFTIGDAAQTLTATVAPANATNKKVTWSSNKTDVATVDENGTVTAVGIGEATITVTTEDGGKTASCTVRVNPVKVTEVTLDKTTLTFTIGDAAQTLTATVAPANATNKKVTWTSNKIDVATVDENGTVTAVGVGEATITVTTEDGGKTASCTVTVNPVKVTEVTLDKTTLTFTIGDAAQTLTATVAPANATNKKVTWTSNKTDVATVDENGKVTAVGVGEATITVTTEDGGKTASSTVTVNPVKVTELTLDKTTLTFTIGDAAQTLTATVAPANATNKKVTWTSNKTDVATVDENGKVTAVGVGEATITVTTEDGGKTAACTVKVNAKPDTPTAVTGVTLDKATLTFTIGDAAQTLTATVAPENATNKKVTWTSSNAKVATVANGTVTAVGVGEATITVTTEDGGKTAACWVKVKAKPADTPKPTPEAVEDVILARLEVSPNPFSTQLRIVNPEGIAVSYELVNLMGLVLRRGVFAGSDTMVDTTDLPTGLYFVRLTGENGAKRVLRVFHY